MPRRMLIVTAPPGNAAEGRSPRSRSAYRTMIAAATELLRTVLGPRSLVLLLAGLTILAAAGCGGSAGGEGDQRLGPVADRLVASTLTLGIPDIYVGSSASMTTPTPTAQDSASVVIGNTSGTGVSLRSDCLDAARSGGGWADATAVTVLEFGSDRCAGWTRVASAAGTNSWVRNEYLVGLTAPPVGSGVASPPTEGAPLRLWVEKLTEAAWRVALLMRSTPGRGNGILAPTYLGKVAAEAETLTVEVDGATEALSVDCVSTRPPMRSAAKALGALATAAQQFFNSPAAADTRAVEDATDLYISAQAGMATAVNACLGS